MDRRRFLSLAAAAASAAASLVVAVPVLRHLLGPLRRPVAERERPWLPLGPIDSFEDGVPQRVVVEVEARDGWEVVSARRAAWVVRDGASALVLSSVCPHLGCSVKWKAEAASFACPCHASGFTAAGERTHGPARRGLDPLPSRISGGVVEIRWTDFAPNVAERRSLGG